IEPEADTISQNNSMSAFSYIEDIARILVIQDETEGASELSRILEGEAVLTVGKPENLPIDIGELQKYDGYIVSNVSAERFDDRFLDNLEISIKHSGKGLLVTGGDNSYAPGGYYKTVLEKVLPVNMDVKSKEEDPNLGLVLVIDKSGSMSSGQYGLAKIELAKEAAIRATEVLEKDDMIGVIGFDSAAKWVVQTQKLDNLKDIQDAIGTIRADGGTQILGPLQEAYESLSSVDTKLKHIILLTDGQAERTGYEPLIAKMNSEGITLSTVAVGEGADILLLKALANGGKGRFYATDEFTDIPKIFAKETFLAGKKYLNNKTFTPKLSSYSPILNEIKAVPQLDGYVSTVSKNTARVIFSSDENDPVLAVWQYGLGRTAAWTSDAKGMWTSKWMTWDQSPRFWKNLVSWLLQKKVKDDYSVRGEIVSGKGVFELKLPSDEILKDEKLEAVFVGPSGKEEITTLNPVSPGVYMGNFSGDETGVYLTNVSIISNEDTIKTISSGFIIPFSPEYDIMKQNGEDFLKQLANESGGRIIKNAAEVFSGKLAPSLSINDMTGLMLILLIFLLMLDIAIRRLNIPFEKIDEIFYRVGDIGGRINSKVAKPVIGKLTSRRVRNREVIEVQDDRKYGLKKGTDKKRDDIKEGKQSATVKGSGGQEAESHISRILEKKRKRGL
ncbi:MAG: VWA domain-containing protein, partial [Clostridiaceae bacterium]|nr:VWA domain-containing protein [Clostridiaceae bacterium]